MNLMKRTFKIADLFCGAGGTSAGAVEAAESHGYHVELTAVNHWPVAIDTHTANHPGARHLCTGIDAINPRDLFAEGELDLLWASPECTHHSIARGGKPINDQSRSTAWCVTRWAEALRPPHILIENVPEFATWGPIGSNGRPLKSKKGSIFQAWLEVFRSLGYRVDYRLFCAADFGDPTTRTRLFIECVRGRKKIVWPDATHSKAPDLLTQRRWTPARDIIDWDRKGQFIFNRDRSLADNTLGRIISGLDRQDIEPFILPGFGEREGQAPRVHSVDCPLPTVCAGGHFTLVEPFIIAMEHGGSVDSIERPLRTITTARGGAMAVIDPMIIELRGTAQDQIRCTGKSVDAPLGTVTAGGIHHGICEAFLVQCAHGNGDDPNGNKRRVRSINDPLPTVCGNRGDLAVAEPFVLGQQSGAVARSVELPMPTVSTAGAIALAEPYIIKYYGTGTTSDIAAPLDTVTTRERFGLVDLEAESPTGSVMVEVAVTIAGKNYAIACIQGIWCLVCKRAGRILFIAVRFRMLQPHELALAQGFPRGYQFTGTKTDQVKQIGNAVPRRLARALVGAVLSQNSDVSALVDAEEGKEVAA